MPAEEMIEVDSMTEEEVVDIITETMTMMIERQEIGDRVHHHHLGKLAQNFYLIYLISIKRSTCDMFIIYL